MAVEDTPDFLRDPLLALGSELLEYTEGKRGPFRDRAWAFHYRYRLIASVPRPGKDPAIVNLHEVVERGPSSPVDRRWILDFHCGPRARGSAYFRFCFDDFQPEDEPQHVHMNMVHERVHPNNVNVVGLPDGFMNTVSAPEFIDLVRHFVQTGTNPVTRK